MDSITVKPISNKKDKKDFIKFQWEIYKDHPYWVPPLLMERYKLIDKKNNPFYKHSEAEFFIARINDKIVGRIGAIINHNHNQEHNENIGFFGFFECIKKQDVANALFDEVKNWLKQRGVGTVRGPANPSVNDEYGLLIDGFDKSPVMLMPYNPIYYMGLIEKAGFKKIKELYSYHLTTAAADLVRLERVANLVKQRDSVTFRSIDMKNFNAELEKMKRIYREAWQNNWGSVKMTDEEFAALAKDLKSILMPEFIIFAEKKSEIIGFALSLPDINIPLKYNKKGRLIPGIIRLLYHKKKIDGVRVIVLGVLPEHQKSGAAAGLFYETVKTAIDVGFTWGEAGWVLDDNVMMNRSAEMFNGKRVKTYAIYQTDF